MDKPISSNQVLDALAGGAIRIFRPLIKILLRHGVSYRTCADWLRWCYVDVANREYTLPGRKQSKSRVAVLTGLTRVDVDRLSRLPPPHLTEQEEHYHRAARVLNAWQYERRYRDASGVPIELPYEATEGPSFTQLVNEYSGGTPPRAVMDELVRIGCIKVSDERQIRLVRDQLITNSDEQDLLNLVIMNMSAGRLLDTIIHNIELKEGEKRLQLMVHNPQVRIEELPQVKHFIENKGRELIREIDAWLHEKTLQSGDAMTHAPGSRPPDQPMTPSQGSNEEQHFIRVGLGVYYFQEESQQDELNPATPEH